MHSIRLPSFIVSTEVVFARADERLAIPATTRVDRRRHTSRARYSRCGRCPRSSGSRGARHAPARSSVSRLRVEALIRPRAVALERQLELGAVVAGSHGRRRPARTAARAEHGGQGAPAPRARASPTHGARRRSCQTVCKDERALLGKPERSFIAAAAVVKRDDPAWEPAFRLDRLELALGNVSAPERLGPERPCSITADEEIDVANMVGFRTTATVGGRLSNRSQISAASSGGAIGSRTAISPPDSTHVEQTNGSQSTSRLSRMLDAPDPQAGADVAHFPVHPARFCHSLLATRHRPAHMGVKSVVTVGSMARASTPWGAANVVEELTVPQRAGEKRFATHRPATGRREGQGARSLLLLDRRHGAARPRHAPRARSRAAANGSGRASRAGEGAWMAERPSVGSAERSVQQMSR